MLVETTWSSLTRINWEAYFRCGRDFKDKNPELNDSYYRAYVLREYGIDANLQDVTVVDDEKYLLFLLRWT